MFGYVLVNKPELKVREFDKYRAYYCGLCHALKERHGLFGRLTLNYDMTFLVMLLTDLYDRPEEKNCSRCIVHPFCKHERLRNEISDYCADMCVYLAYYKSLDDWQDEHKLKKLFFSGILKRKALMVEKNYPEKTAFIRNRLELLASVENEVGQPIDRPAKIFGEIMAEIFCFRDDYWKNDLYKTGLYLGKFIYLLDAYDDIDVDLKTGSYNPLKEIHENDNFEEQVLNLLLLMIGEATDAFERLPLVENVEILRNILYSGVWVKFRKAEDGSI